MTWKLSTLPRWHHVGIIVFCRNEYEYMILLVLATHQIIFRFLSRGDQQLPNGFHKHLKMRRKFLVVFLGVQTHIITNLGLDLLQQTSFGFVLYLKLLQSSQNHQKKSLKSFYFTYWKIPLTRIIRTDIHKANWPKSWTGRKSGNFIVKSIEYE